MDWTGDGIFQCNPDTLWLLYIPYIGEKYKCHLIYSFYFQGNLEKLALIYNTVLYGENLLPTLEPESLMTDLKGSITGFLKIYLNTRITSDKIWPLYTGAGFNLGHRALGDVFRKKALLLCRQKGHRHSRWCVLP